MRRRRRLINLSMVSLIAIVLPVRQEAPQPSAAAPIGGEAAIEALGGRLTSTARRNGLTAAALKTRLRADESLEVDAGGRLLVVDTDLGGPDAQAADEAAGAPGAPEAAPIPYEQTFLLHSRPGSSRVVYLDFDGHYVNGTAWNNNYTGGAAFNAEPYDTNSNPASFSNAEMDVVQRVWQRVSEDFAPFDVDVTTEAPAEAAITRSSSSDQSYGTRLLVTSTQTIYQTCTCGGIAYVGVFDLTSSHAMYQPAFVFTRGVGSGDKNIAEAASHEIGHTLGLYHDGSSTTSYYSGQGAWAPIMGVGYYKPVTQWSRGEYANANNAQDDLAVIQSHGLAVRPDDVGDAIGVATTLTGPNLAFDGVISTGSDRDVYGFAAGAGGATFTVTPATYGPDLDVRLELFDASGAIVAQADPATGITSADVAYGLDASITVTLTAGTYYLRVSGTGVGSPTLTGYSNYGSLGQYRLSGSIGQADTTNTPPVAVATATPTGAVAGQSVAFSAAGSLDPDGTIASYRWAFGDGATSTLANPQRAYTTPGTYTATLTVTDQQGAVGTATATVNVLAPNVRVQSIQPGLVTRGGRTTATALVTITDSLGRPVKGASVQANWTGVVTSPTSGSTNSAGTVKLASPPSSARTGTWTITIANVLATGKPYNPTLNLVTSASVTR